MIFIEDCSLGTQAEYLSINKHSKNVRQGIGEMERGESTDCSNEDALKGLLLACKI
jgi:hypothetical protein